MEINQILSADILDLLFDNRNKAYGAYELRQTYQRRITKALLITALIALLAFTSALVSGSLKNDNHDNYTSRELVITSIKPDEKLPERLPPPEKKLIPPVKTVIWTPPIIVKEVVNPPPTKDDLIDAKIDLFKQDGIPYDGTPGLENVDRNRGVIEGKKEKEPDEIIDIVEVQAKFAGDWEKFLRKNLDPQVPIDKGAPSGTYTIIIQFVVDKEGNVSDIKPLTNLGYGMEQEAIRVLKKATKWQPAIQNGYKVKAYRQQPITFLILESE